MKSNLVSFECFALSRKQSCDIKGGRRQVNVGSGYTAGDTLFWSDGDGCGKVKVLACNEGGCMAEFTDYSYGCGWA